MSLAYTTQSHINQVTIILNNRIILIQRCNAKPKRIITVSKDKFRKTLSTNRNPFALKLDLRFDNCRGTSGTLDTHRKQVHILYSNSIHYKD